MKAKRASPQKDGQEPIRDDCKRLIQAARILHPHLDSEADICRHINVSHQSFSNWKLRGLPQDKIVSLAMHVGCRAEWLATGECGMTESAIDQLFHSLPKPVLDSALDYLQFQVRGNPHKLIAGEKAVVYNAWIEKIRADLQKRKEE